MTYLFPHSKKMIWFKIVGISISGNNISLIRVKLEFNCLIPMSKRTAFIMYAICRIVQVSTLKYQKQILNLIISSKVPNDFAIITFQ